MGFYRTQVTATHACGRPRAHMSSCQVCLQVRPTHSHLCPGRPHTCALGALTHMCWGCALAFAAPSSELQASEQSQNMISKWSASFVAWETTAGGHPCAREGRCSASSCEQTQRHPQNQTPTLRPPTRKRHSQQHSPHMQQLSPAAARWLCPGMLTMLMISGKSIMAPTQTLAGTLPMPTCQSAVA